jgi:ABC-type transport system involved in multi-copper enzyme maturation permease subunit
MSMLTSFIPFAGLMRRELIVLLRRKSAWAGAGALVLMAVGGVWMFSAMPGPRTMSEMVFNMGLTWGYFISLLIVPAVAAVAIASERQNLTLDLLLLTLARPRTIVLAKTLTAFLYFLLLCIGVLPVAGVVFFYVGVDSTQFVQGAGILFAATLAHASLGVAAGTSQRNPMRAIVNGVALAALLSAGLLPVLFGVTLGYFYPAFWRDLRPDMALSVVPFLRISSVLRGGGLPWSGFWGAVAYQCVIFALGLVLAVVLLRWHTRRHPAVDPARGSVRARFGRRAPGIRDGLNPIYVKESRIGTFSLTQIPYLSFLRAWHVVFAGGFLLAWLSTRSLMRSNTLQIELFVYAMTMLFSAFAPVGACASLIREKRTATYALLATSLITHRQIAFGHFFAAFQGIVVLMLAGTAGVLSTMLLGREPNLSWWQILVVLLVASLQFPVLIAVGVLAAAYAKTLPRAIALAYAALFAYSMLPWFVHIAWSLFVDGYYGGDYADQYRSSVTMSISDCFRSPLQLLVQMRPGGGFAFAGSLTEARLYVSLIVHGFIWIPIVLCAGAWMARVARPAGRFQAFFNRAAQDEEF